jgi:hypothetical protein
MRRMEPARSIIKRLGGPAEVSKVTRRAYTAPYRWMAPIEKRGTGGLIPQKHHLALLAYAREKGVPLSAADFLPIHDASSDPVSKSACGSEPAVSRSS